MDFIDFENASVKQIEAVLLIASYPAGEGLTYKKAAAKLGISESGFSGRIRCFKNRCPETWKEIGKKEKIIKEGNSKSCLTNLLWNYRNSAKKRELSFELTEEQFRDLTKQNCWYCGAKPTQQMIHNSVKDFYLYNGIDRIDNSKGYTLANSLPCCGRCNRMKSSLSAEDFINQAKKITYNLS